MLPTNCEKDDCIIKQEKRTEHLDGQKLINLGMYKEAVLQLNKADEYPGAAELKNQAKYAYCQATADRPDEETRTYLADLEKIGYPGMDDLKRQVEAWKLEVVVEEVKSYEVSVKLTFYGGPTDGIEGYRAVARHRDGTSDAYISSRLMKSGSTDSLSLKNINGGVYQKLMGIDIYDSNGILLGKYTK